MKLKGLLSLEALVVIALLLGVAGIVLGFQAGSWGNASKALDDAKAANEALACSALIDAMYINDFVPEMQGLECIAFREKASSQKNNEKKSVVLLNGESATVKEGNELKIVVGGRKHYEK
ncbi:hypothetical protein HZB89_01285 [archaeon]|nr:hypothetical protein [archaeon]